MEKEKRIPMVSVCRPSVASWAFVVVGGQTEDKQKGTTKHNGCSSQGRRSNRRREREDLGVREAKGKRKHAEGRKFLNIRGGIRTGSREREGV